MLSNSNELLILGCGHSESDTLFNNNALVTNAKGNMLIDCGYTIKPAVASLIRSALLREINKSSIQKSCLTVIKEDTIEFLDQDTVGLGKNGLYIMYTGPHVVASCYKTIVLPYPQLSRFLNQAEAKKLNWNYFLKSFYQFFSYSFKRKYQGLLDACELSGSCENTLA